MKCKSIIKTICFIIIVCPVSVILYNVWYAINNDNFTTNTILDIIRNNKELLPAMITLAIGLLGYIQYIDITQSKELESFNQRFFSKNIAYSNVYNDLVTAKVKPVKKLTGEENEELNQREILMRFIEELQLSIESGRLKKKHTHYMFGYYAGEIVKLNTTFVEDFYEPCWYKFREFAAIDYISNSEHNFLKKKWLLFRFMINGYQNLTSDDQSSLKQNNV